MLYWIYEQWEQARISGADWADAFSFLNILQYITVRAGLATVLSFLLIFFFEIQILEISFLGLTATNQMPKLKKRTAN